MSEDMRKSTDKAKDAEKDTSEPFIIAGIAAILVALITVPVLVGAAIFLPLRNRIGRPEWAVIGVTALVGLLFGIGAYMREYGTWLSVMVTGNGSRLDMPLLGLLLAGGLLASIAGLIDGTRVTQSLPGMLGRRSSSFDRPSLIPDAKAKQRASTVSPPGGLTPDAAAHSITAPNQQGGRSFPIGIGMQGVPVMLSEREIGMHGIILGSTGSGKTETIKSLAGSLLDLGWAGAILDLKEDTKAGGLRDFCYEYANAHGMLYQELCLSAQAPEYWFNPLSGMGPDEAQDSILSLLEFDDAYWQNLNRKMLAQTLRLHLAAHQVDPATFPYPTTFDIGKTLQQAARIPAATKKMRAALESVSPGSTKDPFDMMIQPTDDAAKSAGGFGMKLTNLYDTNAGKAILLPSPGQQELDITRDGITYVGLDTLGKPDLTKIVSSSMLQRMSVYASQRTTGAAGAVKSRFLIIDEANWVNREIVMNLLSRARSAGICVFLCTQGPLDWVDKTGDDWARLTQNINVAIIMAQGEPKSAEVCADYLGTQEIMEVSRQIADGRMYDMGSAKMEVVHRVTPQQLREMTIGEAIIRVGKPTEWVSWMRVQQRRPDISPMRR